MHYVAKKLCKWLVLLNVRIISLPPIEFPPLRMHRGRLNPPRLLGLGLGVPHQEADSWGITDRCR